MCAIVPESGVVYDVTSRLSFRVRRDPGAICRSKRRRFFLCSHGIQLVLSIRLAWCEMPMRSMCVEIDVCR
jgi:hypothetical protein